MACFIFIMSDDSKEYITANRYLDAVIKLHERVSKKGATIKSFKISNDKCSVVKKAEATKSKVVLDDE